MYSKEDKKLADFLHRIFADAHANELKLDEDNRQPLTGCAVLTDTGSLFGSVIGNAASHDNPDGSNPVAEALETAEGHKMRISADFKISGVAVTGAIDPATSEFVPIDWDFFWRERRILEEAGLNTVLYLCPQTKQQAVLGL